MRRHQLERGSPGPDRASRSDSPASQSGVPNLTTRPVHSSTSKRSPHDFAQTSIPAPSDGLAREDDWENPFPSEAEIAAKAAAAARSWNIAAFWRNVPWKTAALTLLGVVALGQAALIATWLWNRPTATIAVGQLTISSEPPGAAVLVDGEARGQSPLTVSLPAGSHDVEIAAGAFRRTQRITVAAGGEASVHVQLESVRPRAASAPTGVTGGLQISSDPSGARVWIDGAGRGTTPLTLSNVAAGRHEVTVRTASRSVARSVTVEPGSTVSMFISMSAGGEFASGWLALRSEVPGQIFEGETLVGTTETPRIMLAAGPHQLQIVNAALDYHVSQRVEIKAGQTASLSLAAPHGTLYVNALPWANVLIDGKPAGETPIGNLSIPIGTHELVFRHPDFAEQRKTVVVGSTAPVRVGVDLRK